MPKGGNPSKHITSDQESTAVKFFKAKVEFKTIRMQFKMSESPCSKFSTIQRGTMRPPPCVGALYELRWDEPLS
jgi:hypothetical protein